MKHCALACIQRIGRGIAASLAVVLLTSSALAMVPPKQAHAIFDFGSASLAVKEYTLDAIAYQIAQGLVSHIVTSTTDWVNSGFEGSPAFVTNLDEYLFNELDQLAGDIIHGSDLDFLCQPFQLDIRFALNTAWQSSSATSEGYRHSSQCTLSGAAENVQNFFDGTFADGGWERWFEVWSEPQNNPWGAYRLSQQYLGSQLAQAEANERQQLDWGNGFLSVEDCSGGTCITVTPGALISDRINSVLSLPENSLVNADEINELISALMNQLSIQALSGVRGLLGLSESQGGAPSFLDQIGDPAYDTPIGGGSGATQAASLNTAMVNESAYAGLYSPLVSELEAIETRAAAAAPTCPAVADELAETRILLGEVRPELASANTNVTTLRDLQVRLNTSLSPSGQGAADQEFVVLQSSGVLHTQAEVNAAQSDTAALEPQIDDLGEAVDDAIATCA